MSLPADLVAALRDALADLEPSRLVDRALPAPPARGRVRVIAVGKAAPAMAHGALRAFAGRVDDLLLVAPDGVDAGDLATHPRATLLRASHPLPDARSEAAAREAIARASALARGDHLLALISGGASALLSCPPGGVPLARKVALVAALLASGAPIEDVNVVRRHASAIKGGRLARAAGAAEVVTLFVSDVVGGEAFDVGSGPTVADPTSMADAHAVLARFAPHLRDEAATWLEESPKPGERGDPAPIRLADPDSLARAVAARLRALGFDARALPAETGDVTEMAARRVAAARTLARGGALVIACEPTVALPPRPGRGGRAGRVALLAAAHLPDDVALLCAASDGVDGASGTSGAVVTRADVEGRRLEAETALAAYDDAPLHRRLGTAVVLGPTGTNLTDVHVLARRGG